MTDIRKARGKELEQLKREEAHDAATFDAYHERILQPKKHEFKPRADGGQWGRCCVLSAQHPVHAGADVIPLFRDRRQV